MKDRKRSRQAVRQFMESAMLALSLVLRDMSWCPKCKGYLWATSVDGTPEQCTCPSASPRPLTVDTSTVNGETVKAATAAYDRFLTLQDSWESGEAVGIPPIPSDPTTPIVMGSDLDLRDMEAKPSPALWGFRLRQVGERKADRLIRQMSEASERVSTLSNGLKACLYAMRLLRRIDTLSTWDRMLPQVVRLSLLAQRYLDDAPCHTYEGSEGLSDTTVLTDDSPAQTRVEGSLQRYNALTVLGVNLDTTATTPLHTETFACDCRELGEDSPNVVESANGVFSCATCGFRWHVNYGEVDYTSGRRTHEHDSHVIAMEAFDSDGTTIAPEHRSTAPATGKGYVGNAEVARVDRYAHERFQNYVNVAAYIDGLTRREIVAIRDTGVHNGVRRKYVRDILRLLGVANPPMRRTKSGQRVVDWQSIPTRLGRDGLELNIGETMITLPDGSKHQATVHRVPDMTELKLNRAQMETLTARLNARYEETNPNGLKPAGGRW